MQIFLTDDLTFMLQNRLNPSCYASAAAVGIQFELNPVADEHADAVQTHFAGKVRERHLTGTQLYAKKRVRERLFDDPFHNLCLSHNLRDVE